MVEQSVNRGSASFSSESINDRSPGMDKPAVEQSANLGSGLASSESINDRSLNVDKGVVGLSANRGSVSFPSDSINDRSFGVDKGMVDAKIFSEFCILLGSFHGRGLDEDRGSAFGRNCGAQWCLTLSSDDAVPGIATPAT